MLNVFKKKWDKLDIFSKIAVVIGLVPTGIGVIIGLILITIYRIPFTFISLCKGIINYDK